MAADSNFGAASASAEATQLLNDFWPSAVQQIHNLATDDFKNQELPLARIKKIMKLDEDVKMISAEAPVLFAKAAEVFISELSLRAWIHTEDNKRKTLQRNDIALAISKYDQFDFLIDIVPRDEQKSASGKEETVRASSALPDQIQYFLQLAQQQQQQQQQSQQQQQQQQQVQAVASTPVHQTVSQTEGVQVQKPAVQVQQQVVTQPTQSVQQVVTQAAPLPQQTAAVQLPSQYILDGQIIQQPIQIQNLTQGVAAMQPQVVQLQTPQTMVQQLGQVQQIQQVVNTAAVHHHQQQPVQQTAMVPQQVATAQPTVVQPATQVYQQVITPSGEVQSIPIQLTPEQLQSLQMQVQGKTSAQSIMIQPSQTVQTQPADQLAQLTAGAQSLFQLQQLTQQTQQIFMQQTQGGEQHEAQAT